MRFEDNCYSLVLRYDPSYSNGIGFRIDSAPGSVHTTCGTAGGLLVYNKGGIYRIDLPKVEYNGKTYWTSFEYVPDEGVIKLTGAGEK